jgi:c-di-GMP-binding flagellar brake protein YcgR
MGRESWAAYRVEDGREICALLRRMRDAATRLTLHSPSGDALSTTLWAIDDARGRLSFNAEGSGPQLERLVDGDEALAVAYLDQVKLQFDLFGLVLVRGGRANALQAAAPAEMYRFQRRNAFRVQAIESHAPRARLRHPSIPEMALELRVVDFSASGCALLLPAGVPPIAPGCTFAQVEVELDPDTRFAAALTLHHVSSMQSGDGGGVRLGCEWSPLDGQAARSLQRCIDQTQKRRRVLALD